MPKTASKPVIAVDIDDTLVPHVEDLINWHNQEYGTHMSFDQYHSRDPKDWGAKTIEQAIKRVQRFFDSPTFLEAQPLKESLNVLRQLSRDYELIVITSRDYIIEDVTRNWLDKHYPELFKEAHFTARFNLEGADRAKSAAGLAAGAKYLIDDTLENAEDAATAGIKVLLFGDYSWNQTDTLPKGVTRVKDWQAVLGYFENE